MSDGQKLQIAVLMGGWSGEREVSLNGGKAISSAIRALGHDAIEIDVQPDLQKLLNNLSPKPDLVINNLHGPWGEDGHIQSILDIMGLPYNTSGQLSSAMAMDKVISKKIFISDNIPTPEYKVLPIKEAFGRQVMDFPYVMKPINEGSTLGVYIVKAEAEIPEMPSDWTYGDHVLVERYIPGRELSVPVLGDRAVGVIELRPTVGFYDYKAKYTDGITEHIVPAKIDETVYQRALKYALQAHRALGCQGMSRADFRYDDTKGEPGDLYLLEVNTQPGMVELSIVPDVVRNIDGMSFKDLVQWMIEDTLCRANKQ
jgi:D-alanine-D-alanine ligase